MTAPSPGAGLSSQAEAALLDTDQEEAMLLADDEEQSHSPVYQAFAFLARGEGALWTFAVFVLICIVFGIAAPDFFSRANWVATSEYAVEYLLLAIGETFVIATAGIGLSVGAILSCCSRKDGICARSRRAHSNTGKRPPANSTLREVLSFALRNPHFSGPSCSLPAKSTQIVRQ